MDDYKCDRITLNAVTMTETKDEAGAKIAGVIYGLHRADWEKWPSDVLGILGMSAVGLPEELSRDASRHLRVKADIATNVCL